MSLAQYVSGAVRLYKYMASWQKWMNGCNNCVLLSMPKAWFCIWELYMFGQWPDSRLLLNHMSLMGLFDCQTWSFISILCPFNIQYIRTKFIKWQFYILRTKKIKQSQQRVNAVKRVKVNTETRVNIHKYHAVRIRNGLVCVPKRNVSFKKWFNVIQNPKSDLFSDINVYNNKFTKKY